DSRLTVDHAALNIDRACKRQRLRDRFRQLNQPAVVDGPASVDHTGTHNDTLARDDGNRSMAEVTQDVNGEFGPVQIFLNDSILDVLNEERQVLWRMNRVRADAASSPSRLDEKRKHTAGRQIFWQVRFSGGNTIRAKMLAREQLVVAD